MSSNIGVMGLGTMGSALARNIASRGFKVSVWNRSPEKVTEFIAQFGETSFYGSEHIEDFVESLELPRKIIVLIPAGKATREVLTNLIPVLEKGDCLMEGGNSFFKDTEELQNELREKGIHFLGCGVSGGEEGALYGPSLMPGGSHEAWTAFETILSKIAAEDFEGRACVSYMGGGGAGHYVKMVHNGIEYAEMQMIAEAYDLLKQVYKLKTVELLPIFERFKKGPLRSFLTDIAVDVLKPLAEDGNPLIDKIMDKAGQKGTGTWTSQEALALGVATPSITQAVFARAMSGQKADRVHLASELKINDLAPSILLSDFVQDLEGALFLSRISHFQQGLQLLHTADLEYHFGLNFPEIIRVWQGGCIIRSDFLKPLHEVVQTEFKSNLYAHPLIQQEIRKSLGALRRVVSTASSLSVPLFTLSASLTHIEASRRERLPADMIQALRDRFGHHGFEREDQEGVFHL